MLISNLDKMRQFCVTFRADTIRLFNLYETGMTAGIICHCGTCRKVFMQPRVRCHSKDTEFASNIVGVLRPLWLLFVDVQWIFKALYQLYRVLNEIIRVQCPR